MPDINVWLALSWGSHPHSALAWAWFRSMKRDQLLYCRLTQLGLLRLLTTEAVMGADCLTVRKAWGVYDRWLLDPKVEFRLEPAEVETLFRRATTHVSHASAPKALGDSYLVALSRACQATLVTLDRGLAALARHLRFDALLLG